MTDKIALELAELVGKAINGEMTAVEVHDIFWDRFWPDKKSDWPNQSSDAIQELIANEIFYAFEDFIVHPEVSPEDVSHGIDEKEFLRRCHEFLPKLKELASK